MAPDLDILDMVVTKLNEIVATITIVKRKGCDIPTSDEAEALSAHHNSHRSLIEFPVGTSIMNVALHIVLFPINALLQFTVPDVRVVDSQGTARATLATAFVGVATCLAWLAIASYATGASLGIVAGECITYAAVDASPLSQPCI